MLVGSSGYVELELIHLALFGPLVRSSMFWMLGHPRPIDACPPQPRPPYETKISRISQDWSGPQLMAEPCDIPAIGQGHVLNQDENEELGELSLELRQESVNSTKRIPLLPVRLACFWSNPGMEVLP